MKNNIYDEFRNIYLSMKFNINVLKKMFMFDMTENTYTYIVMVCET